MTLHKVLKYLAIVIGVIGLIFLARIVATGDEAIKSSADMQSSMVNPILYVAYIVLIAVLVLVIIFVIKGFFTGKIKNTLISLGVFAVIIILSYLLSNGTEVTMNNGELLSANASRWVSAGLRTFYILAAIAIGAMVFSGVKKLIK